MLIRNDGHRSNTSPFWQQWTVRLAQPSPVTSPWLSPLGPMSIRGSIYFTVTYWNLVAWFTIDRGKYKNSGRPFPLKKSLHREDSLNTGNSEYQKFSVVPTRNECIFFKLKKLNNYNWERALQMEKTSTSQHKDRRDGEETFDTPCSAWLRCTYMVTTHSWKSHHYKIRNALTSCYSCNLSS